MMENHKLYPALPSDCEVVCDANNFRLQKICDIQASLENSIQHYEAVRKKYTRARSILHGAAMITGSLSAVLSASGLTTALTGVGLPVGIGLGSVGALFAIISASTVEAAKRLAGKITKHEQTVMLARAKLSTVRDIISKALNDNQISDTEFQLILAELEKFETLKQSLRTFASSQTSSQIRGANEHTETKKSLAEIRAEIRAEVATEFREKLM